MSDGANFPDSYDRRSGMAPFTHINTDAQSQPLIAVLKHVVEMSRVSR
jgi:hypothetical protein